MMNDCINPSELCKDKNSAHYFMCHMTQQEWDEHYKKTFIQKAHEFQYQFNKIRLKEMLNE